MSAIIDSSRTNDCSNDVTHVPLTDYEVITMSKHVLNYETNFCKIDLMYRRGSKIIALLM